MSVRIVHNHSGKRSLYNAVSEQAAGFLNITADFSVGLTVISKINMRELNARTRGTDKATDVLSFPFYGFSPPKWDISPDMTIEDGRVYIGDIAICGSICRDQARLYGHSTEREQAFLFLHGLLHILGYDHTEQGDNIMDEISESILKEAGIVRL